METVEEIFGVTKEELRSILEEVWEKYYQQQLALHEARRKEREDNPC
jgi:hypothetical protein